MVTLLGCKLSEGNKGVSIEMYLTFLLILQVFIVENLEKNRGAKK